MGQMLTKQRMVEEESTSNSRGKQPYHLKTCTAQSPQQAAGEALANDLTE